MDRLNLPDGSFHIILLHGEKLEAVVIEGTISRASRGTPFLVYQMFNVYY